MNITEAFAEVQSIKGVVNVFNPTKDTIAVTVAQELITAVNISIHIQTGLRLIDQSTAWNGNEILTYKY